MQIYEFKPDLFLNNPVSVPFVPIFIKLFYNVLKVFIYENFTKKRDKKDKKDKLRYEHTIKIKNVNISINTYSSPW